MAVTITALDNLPFQDGLHLAATLNAAPNGPVAFYASVSPGVVVGPGSLVPATPIAGGQNQYAVAVRDGVALKPRVHRMGYHVKAVDADGASNEAAEWLCAGANTDWLLQVDHAIHDILVANQTLLERGMQLALTAASNGRWPSDRPALVRKIHRGEPTNEEAAKFPRICHATYALQEDYLGAGGFEAGVPYSDLVPIQSRILCYSMYQSDVEWGFVLRSLGMAVFNVLNSPEYFEFDLDCGMRIFDCMCRGGSLSEFYDQRLDAWVVGFETDWQGQLHAGKYLPTNYPPDR